MAGTRRVSVHNTPSGNIVQGWSPMPESPTQGFRFRRQLLAVPSRSQTQTGVLKRATDLSAPLGPSFTTPALIGQKKSSSCFHFLIWTGAYRVVSMILTRIGHV